MFCKYWYGATKVYLSILAFGSIFRGCIENLKSLYLGSGKAKVTVVSEQGKEAVVAILRPNNFFGEGCLAGQPRRMATVSAMAEGLFMRLEKASIVRVIHDEPAFSRNQFG
jgi:CRP-like cAMP-binding protein